MTLSLTTETLPLQADADGAVRVGKTRVTLDTVVAAFSDGATAEEIVQRYPSLGLADVYHVIGYYLRRPSEVEAYLQQRKSIAEAVRMQNETRFDPQGVRDRLMTTATEQMIREMAAVVVREAQPDAIILFGSHAAGSAGPDSDVDLMVIEQGPFGLAKDRRREMTRLWRALAGFAVAKDILVYSREEVEHWRGARNHVVARALREGKLLYGSL